MHPDITIVIIDTDTKVLANNALNHSSRLFPTARTVALTNTNDSFEGHEKYIIDKINTIEDYNNIVINLLPDIISTNYALIIQFDGFIINPNLFSELFLNFDYIGASWPHFQYNNVGNGGFSLRSLKLLKATKELSHLRKNAMAEDVFICRYIKSILEYDFGIHFAPMEIADFFSTENKKNRNKSFGFHGLHHLPAIYSNDIHYLLKNLSPRFFIGKNYQLLANLIDESILQKYLVTIK